MNVCTGSDKEEIGAVPVKAGPKAMFWHRIILLDALGKDTIPSFRQDSNMGLSSNHWSHALMSTATETLDQKQMFILVHNL